MCGYITRGEVLVVVLVHVQHYLRVFNLLDPLAIADLTIILRQQGGIYFF